MENDKMIAVLIDGDNVSDKYVKYIFDEIANHGTPTYKRIYGDWTRPQMSSWKSVLLNYSITPIQQYSYTTGKNATDATLIIDAMDILYSHNVDGFCIVSSDSDFTRLAARLREAGMYVLGMGEKKTPKPFIAACEKFKYLEILATVPANPTESINVITNDALMNDDKKTDNHDKGTGKLAAISQESPKEGMASIQELIEAIKMIVTEGSDEDGWVSMGEVGKRLNKRYPDFDTRNYGHLKLTPLISSFRQFEIQSRKIGTSDNKYIRNKISSSSEGQYTLSSGDQGKAVPRKRGRKRIRR